MRDAVRGELGRVCKGSRATIHTESMEGQTTAVVMLVPSCSMIIACKYDCILYHRYYRLRSLYYL